MKYDSLREALLAALLAAGLALPAFAQIPGRPSEKVFPALDQKV